MVDWTTGELNARSWVIKMLIDGLGNDYKKVLVTNVSTATVNVPNRTGCKQLTRMVNQDMVGGNLCSFNMSGDAWPKPSFEACAVACCADRLCDHFTTIRGDPAAPPGYNEQTCTGQAPCVHGGWCCYFKDRGTMPRIAVGYQNGSIISGTTTPSSETPEETLPIWARGFAPADGVTLPGGQQRAILLANHDENSPHSVTFEGLRGAEVWSVVHGQSGMWSIPYAIMKATEDALVLPPLAVMLVLADVPARTS
jgi:hypothetical protein